MITIREVTYDDRKEYDKLEGKYHYMGESHGAGDTMRFIFEENGQWLALMTWGACSYALKARDERIGWNKAMRQARLKLIINNRRFTLLKKKGECPNLASQILGLAIREIPDLWKKKWGYAPLLAETFSDIEYARGTCYRAAGWEEVGKTKGFTRTNHARDFYIANERPKLLFMKPFRKDAWDLIVSNNLPSEYEPATHTKATGILPIKSEQAECLHDFMCHVTDPRGHNRTVHIGTILTLFTMGVAAGAKDLSAVHRWCKNQLTNDHLRMLGCPKAKDVNNNIIKGKRVCPSYSSFHYLLMHKDKKGNRDFDVSSYAEQLSKWMTAQAGTLPRHLTIDGKFMKEVTGLVSLVDADTQDVIAVAPATRKEGVVGQSELPVSQDLLTRMDLSNAVVSADALHCQDVTAQTILEQGGDYVLQVKGNRKNLLEQCQKLCKLRPMIGHAKKKN